jgi:hypothetical protein
MTGQEVILDLLRYIGVTGFTAVANDQRLNRPGLDNDDIRRAFAALNSALQTVQKYGPQALKDDERAAFFNNPATVRSNHRARRRTGRARLSARPRQHGCWVVRFWSRATAT